MDRLTYNVITMVAEDTETKEPIITIHFIYLVLPEYFRQNNYGLRRGALGSQLLCLIIFWSQYQKGWNNHGQQHRWFIH